MKQAIVLSIAGSDSGAGAGIQADIKICASLGVYCASVITAITAQNTQGVSALTCLEPALVKAQLDSIAEDFNIQAIKIGMLGHLATAECVADFLRAQPAIPVILDPVLVSTSGHSLVAGKDLDGQAKSDTFEAQQLLQFYRHTLIPMAFLTTPNLAEAAQLLDCPEATSTEQMEQQAEKLLKMGAINVLIKGGHLKAQMLTDLLHTPTETHRYRHDKISTRNTHGTGCTLSSAIAAKLCQELSLPRAVDEAIAHLQKAIQANRNVTIGTGYGPVNPFHAD